MNEQPCVLVQMSNERPWVVPARSFGEAARKVTCDTGKIRRFSWLNEPMRALVEGDYLPPPKCDDD